jgi:hypothetical protein
MNAKMIGQRREIGTRSSRRAREIARPAGGTLRAGIFGVGLEACRNIRVVESEHAAVCPDTGWDDPFGSEIVDI